MKILAIDSTAVAASAAIIDDNKILAELTVNNGHTHSETLLPLVEKALYAASLDIDSIDLFAVSAGPGSFTGVRIGISLIKGLCFKKNKPIAGVSSLEALSYNLKGFEGIACPVMDARRNQVYTAIFQNGQRMTDDMLIPVSELEDMLKEYNTPIRFTGDGYDLALNSISLPYVTETPVRLRLQSAVSVALCAKNNYEQNKNIFTDSEVQPIYLRASQAERERNERIKENG
ncbi:MAG: tRNA (adenosine(37)-N6)-threonylcarbamoyltransferase complex dimerization subunit type 1 TsaB [Ruminococcaceae bacterium]|nr:tRNA (adenosine(37)-N6)-threonylcarbamoyltransferase complex dimerization subunit type 1 TsaB [Oscillospiraceae bacterium]